MNSSDSDSSTGGAAAKHDRTGAPVVLQLLPALETGGVERGTVDIARALTGAGWTSLVASTGGLMVREVLRAGACHIDFPAATRNPISMIANIGRLRRLIAKHGVDLVHARSRAPAWSARSAAHWAGIPLVTTFHGNYSVGAPFKRGYNGIMTRGDRVIAISDFISEQVISRYGTDPGRVRVIHRGIDTEIFNPSAVSAERLVALVKQWRIPDGVKIVMLPGRLSAWKGQQILIEALSRLDRENIRCLIVGADQGRENYVRRVENDVARLGLENTVHLVGHCADMAAAYMLADVVVSTSVEAEAFGRVITEAQAMGRPVIATDHGAARETVIEGKTGWLIAPGDASLLAEAMTRALALDTAAREALARRAIKHVAENFTRDGMCASTLDVYRELLGKNAADPGS